jgi:hypothetical protein
MSEVGKADGKDCAESAEVLFPQKLLVNQFNPGRREVCVTVN